MSVSAKDELIALATAYLTGVHLASPEEYPAEIKAIAAHIGKSRGTFYNWIKKGDPEVQALVKQIENADNLAKAAAGKRALVPSDDHGGTESTLSTTELERELREGLARVAWAMRGFLSAFDWSEGVDEAPLLLADLDAKLRICGAVYRDLDAPYQEWMRRRRDPIPVAAAPGSGPPPQLDLDHAGEDDSSDADDYGPLGDPG